MLWDMLCVQVGWLAQACDVLVGRCVRLVLLSVVMLEPEIRGRRGVAQVKGDGRENNK